MKLITLLLLFASVQLGIADDQTPPRAKPAPAAASDTSAPKPADTAKAPVVRRPAAPASNPHVRPTYPTATANPRVLPIDRTRPVVPSNATSATPVPRRPTVVNQRPGVTNPALRTTRGKLPARTGNELSFAQARAQCSEHHHDRDWWRHHNHTLIVFYGGGYWFWNAGWWFPAWGYSPYYNNYIYDGPIYGYGALSPGDVTAQVQEALAQQGYYYGAIDGVLGPETRDAILRFQADHGLATTAAIDEATLDTLGLT